MKYYEEESLPLSKNRTGLKKKIKSYHDFQEAIRNVTHLLKFPMELSINNGKIYNSKLEKLIYQKNCF